MQEIRQVEGMELPKRYRERVVITSKEPAGIPDDVTVVKLYLNYITSFTSKITLENLYDDYELLVYKQLEVMTTSIVSKFVRFKDYLKAKHLDHLIPAVDNHIEYSDLLGYVHRKLKNIFIEVLKNNAPVAYIPQFEIDIYNNLYINQINRRERLVILKDIENSGLREPFAYYMLQMLHHFKETVFADIENIIEEFYNRV